MRPGIRSGRGSGLGRLPEGGRAGFYPAVATVGGAGASLAGWRPAGLDDPPPPGGHALMPFAAPARLVGGEGPRPIGPPCHLAGHRAMIGRCAPCPAASVLSFTVR